MTDFIIRYGKYAPLVTAVLLIWSAADPPKPVAKGYGRYIIGTMGVLLLYTSIHIIVR
ncbi:MAG: hypothetical protein ABSF97_06490 [Candidatus Sulfotelmatobacter sp.]|jgi:hypothetical protein